MFKKLFCKHDYEMIDSVSYYVHESDSMPCIIKKIFMCKRCGKVKTIEY